MESGLTLQCRAGDTDRLVRAAP